MRYSKIAASALLALTSVFTLNANAGIVLTDPVSKTYQQTSNSPCIFGGPSCQNPDGFSYTSLPNSGLEQDYIKERSYTVQQVIDLVGTTFLVGIDINTTDKPATEQLVYFSTSIGGIQSSANSYLPATPHQFAGEDNGNGYADATLGVFDFTGFALDALVRFDVSMLNATDGVESFFLIRADAGGPGNNVPEPGTTAILGLGLLGMGFAAKRKIGRQA
jgi:hypothetical protein